MKYNIKITNFISGIDLSLFHYGVSESSFFGKVEKIGQDSENVFLSLTENLTGAEITELNTIVSSHVRVEKTELELKALELSDTNLDYHKVRQESKALITAFGDLNAAEKELASRYCLSSVADIIPYYMAQGLSYSDAVKKYKVLRSIDISRAADALAKRASSPVVLYIAVKYMSETDASAFNDAIRNFIVDLKNTAHLGTEYGQSRDGIMNYIENTGSYAQGGGLTSYSMENGYSHDDCKNEFKNYLVYGNKPQEFDVFSS